MIGQNFKQKQTQTASPRQIQLMQLVQLPLMELEQRIKEELETNPTLEEGLPGEADTADPPGGADGRSTKTTTGTRNLTRTTSSQYMEDDPASYQKQRTGGRRLRRPR